MSPNTHRQWILAKRPNGDIADGDLVFQTAPIPSAQADEIVIKTAYLSLDPTNRVWMNEADSYLPAVPLGAPMRGLVSGRVVESQSKAFKVGDLVMGVGSWSDNSASST